MGPLEEGGREVVGVMGGRERGRDEGLWCPLERERGGARDDRHSSHGKYLVGGECAKSKVW